MDVNGPGDGVNNAVDTVAAPDAVTVLNIEQPNAAMKTQQQGLDHSHRVQSDDDGGRQSPNDSDGGTHTTDTNIGSTGGNATAASVTSDRDTAESTDRQEVEVFYDLGHNKKLPKKVRRYYKSQNQLLSSIDDIQLQLDEYHQERTAANSGKKTAAACFTASRLSKATFFINCGLLAAKLVAAILSGSLSVVSSVVDSMVDLASGIILWWSSRAIKHVDYSLYPRGRRKLEPVSIVILAVIMSFASIQIIYSSIKQIADYASFDMNCNSTLLENDTSIICGTARELMDILSPCMSGEEGPDVQLDTILICSSTIVIKLILFLICRTINDSIVQALAQDHRNDVVSNASAIAFGIMGHYLLKYLDPAGAILISLYVIVNWFSTAKEQIRHLTGFTATTEFINMVTWVIVNHDERIKYIDDVKAFHFGSKYFVEVDIVLPEGMPNRDSHDIGETLAIKLERLDQVERVFVHIDYETGYRHHLTHI